MSEFKFVQWGKGVPVDYQRLNVMMLNEQYLKDEVDSRPKGSLLVANQATQVTTSGTNNVLSTVSSMNNLPFNVDSNRIVKFNVTGYAVQNDDVTNAYLVYVLLYIDNTNVATSAVRVIPSDIDAFADITYITDPSSPLSQGTHTVRVDVFKFSGAGTTGQKFLTINGSAMRLSVEDIGPA